MSALSDHCTDFPEFGLGELRLPHKIVQVLHSRREDAPQARIRCACDLGENCLRELGLVVNDHGYLICRPPSTTRVVPVMNDASSEAIHRMGRAISIGSAQRPSNEVSCRWPFNSSTLLPAAFVRLT